MDLSAQLDSLDPGSEAGASRAVRLAALERFMALGLPDRRVETWRYTDLTSLRKKGFSFSAPPPDAAALETAGVVLREHDLAIEGARLVFVDGHLAESLSTPPQPEHVGFESAASTLTQDSDGTALAALNTAFASGEHCLRFRGTDSGPVELVFIGSGRQLAPQLRLRIELEAGARAEVIQRFIDIPDAGEAWLNLVTDITLGSESNLSLHRLQLHQPEQVQTTLHRARLAAGAKLTAGNVELGGALVRNEFEIALDGEDAEADVFSLTLTRDSQHSDTRIAVDHRAPRTMSLQNQRAILDDSSRAVFNGKVTVQPDAQHIEARQRSDSLLLSPRAEVDAKPELEIYADQVVCSHGATVGELSDDHLFYLRARGIDAPTARGILTAAFADAILERIALDSLRESARLAVGERLPRAIETT